ESFQRGIVGAARSQNPNSFNAQFFITYADASFLDGQYTVFGKVASGMEAVDALEKGPQSANGAVENPDKIIKATIEYKLDRSALIFGPDAVFVAGFFVVFGEAGAVVAVIAAEAGMTRRWYVDWLD